ncbi:MAG: tetratricopeptide repeat protein [Bacteroidetes bacterium]|nr:tetratricopeptide repeat protein [Bacteroidota bacterium]
MSKNSIRNTAVYRNFFWKPNFIFLSFIFLSCFFTFCSAPQQPEKENQTSTPDTNKRLAKNYLSDCKKLFLAARKSDSILLSQTAINETSAKQAIKDFTDFAYYCHSDSLAPMFLIKTAQVAKSINNLPQAKLVLDKCIEDYPNFDNRPAALFLLAQLYDEPSYLNDEQHAKKLYQKIINEFPKSDYAQSAKGALHFIGKTDEEIMKEILKKKK